MSTERMDPEQYTAAALDRARALSGVDAGLLASLRAAGREAFTTAELPGRKTESWKYSRVGALLEEGLLDRPGTEPAPVEIPAFPGLDADRVLIVDGVPRDLPAVRDDLRVERLSEIDDGPATDALALLGTLAPASERPFVALNAALAEDAVVIQVPRGRRPERPLELVFAQGTDDAPCGAQPRVLVVVESGAELTLIERQVGDGRRFANGVIEVVVEDGARLDHLRLGLDAGEGRWLTALDVRVGRDARYALHQALVGSAFRRNEIGIRLAGEGSEVAVGGATLTRDRTHLDNQMNMEHVVPHGTSTQVFRSIAGERSRTVLNGRIHILRDAQKTAAELSSKNLLLSADAEIDAKPELEIYADDVTCAHGATVGRLDEQGLFYLRSRGIPETEARTLLSFAFLASVVDAFPVEAVRDAARAALEAAFSAPARQEASS
jgi:Fe-S cluster assembly protein SufD